MVIAARIEPSAPGPVSKFTHAPRKAKNTAPIRTGRVTVQSILPRRWNMTVPVTPVNAKVNSAVAIAA